MDNPNPIKELFKEFALINRKSVFADQARIEFPKGEDHPFDLEVLLTPTSGPFKDACVKFSVKLPANYPRSAPTVKCLNRIFHPNVSTTGNVCFSMFSGDWNASYRLEHFVNGLLWFLQNPNPDSALNSVCSIRDPKEFEKMVRTAIAGLPAKGKIYDKIIMVDSSLPENVLAQFFTEMAARGLTLRGMLDFHTGALPELSWLRAVKGTAFDADVIKLIGVASATVAVRARRLKVDERLVMKELVLRVGDNFALALVRGPARVCFARVAALFGVKEDQCRLASVLDITTKLKLNYRAVPAFGHGALFTAGTLVEASVAAEPDVAIYTATGVPNLILKTTFAHMKPFLADARVADFLAPASPAAAPAAAAPAAVAPAAVAAPAPAAVLPVTVVAPVAALPVVVEAAAPAAAVPAAAVAPVAAAPAVAVEPAVTRALIPAPFVATPSPSPANVANAIASLTQRLELLTLSFNSLSDASARTAEQLALARQQQRSALQVST